MLTMDIIYPAAGLATLVGSVVGLRVFDHLAGKMPRRIVDAATRHALLQADGLTVLRRTPHR